MGKAQIIALAIILLSSSIVAALGLFIKQEKQKVARKIKFWK